MEANIKKKKLILKEKLIVSTPTNKKKFTLKYIT